MMGEKEAASQALEGTFDTNALRAMMNGGKDTDILAALANTLDTGKKVDARAAWKPTVAKTIVQSTEPKKRKAVATAVTAKAWAQGFLFDIDAGVEHVPVLVGA